MIRIDAANIPSDYHTYRSHTPAFARYIAEKEERGVIPILENGYFGYVRHYFWRLFSVARFEKSDIPPTRELLKKYGFSRGIVFWSGFHIQKPSGSYWIRFGYIFSKYFHHSTRSAFSMLDAPEYWKKWQPNARNHRNKIQKLIGEGKISIDTQASWEAFRDVYKRIQLPHSHRRYFLWRQDFFMKNTPENFRIFIASYEGVPLAGAIFLDDHPTSTYLIAFQHPDAKRYHLGLAIIDRWFADSQKSGYRYMDLDHMQDVLDKKSYAGYTQFKSEIADFDVKFWNVWMKFFL